MEDTLTIPETEQEQVPQEQAPPQDPPSKRLYDGLVSKGLYSKTYDDFQKQFSNPESIQKLHEGLVNQKLYSKSSTDFTSQYFPPIKKNETPLPVPSPSLATPSQSQSPKSEQYLDAPWMTTAKASTVKQKEADSKDINLLGNLWNSFTNSVGSLGASGMDIASQVLNKILPSEDGMTDDQRLKKLRETVVEPARTATTELVGAKVTPKQKKAFENDMFASAAGSLASMVPVMGYPKGAGFVLQAYDNGLQSINNTEAGKNLPESTKTIFATGVGIATGLMMKVGVDKIFGKQSDKIASGLTANVISDLLKTSKEPITADVFNAAMEKAVSGLKDKVISAGGKIGEGAITGGLFGASMEATNIAAEKLTNKATGVEAFEPKTWGEEFGRVLHAGTQMATVGGILGGISVPFSKTRDYIKEKVGEAKTPEDIDALKNEMISKVNEKVGGEDAGQQVSDLIDKYAEVYSKIPPSANNKSAIVDNIQERDALQKQVDEKTQQLQTVDPAFHEPILQEINAANGRIDEINKEIAEKAKQPEEPKESAVTVEQPQQVPEPITVGGNEPIPEKFPKPSITVEQPQTISEPITIGNDEPTTGEANKPLPSNEGQSKGQEDKGGLPSNTEPNSEGEPKATTPVLEGGGGKEPPKVIPIEGEGKNSEDWTAIRKEKQREIKAVKDAYEKQGVKAWSETMQKGLEKTQKAHPDKTLYDAALTTMHQIRAGAGHGDLTTDEALATMQYLKRELGAKRSQLADAVTSDNDLVRQAALMQDEALGNDYENAALAIKDITTTAGRTLNYAQSELRLDPDHGLQIRRMQLLRAKGGEKLTPEEMKFTEEKWNQEREIMKQEAAVREQGMKEDFDNRIAELQKEHEEKLKQAGKTAPAKTAKEKSLSQKGKNIADKIRQLKKPKGGTNIDFTLGTWDLAVEGIAKLVEAGSTIAEAIEKLVKDGTIAFKEAKDRDGFENHIVESIPEQKGKSEILNDIKEFAKENGTEEITNEMVGKGLIRDYVNSHIGEVEQADILDVAAKDLKEVLPNASKEKLIEAYLKENEFKQPTKKDLEGGIAEAKKQLNNIAKLTEDIEDLNGLKSIRQRNFPNERAKSEAEQALLKEKADKIKEINERRKAILADNKKIQDESIRQLQKVKELKDKKDKLEKGIIEKQKARDKKTDTPEIEKLKAEVKEIEKKLAKEKSDRDAQIKKGNRMIESESIRQMTRINDLNERKERLEKGIREKRAVTAKVDTPEIEALKKQVKEVDKNLHEAEALAKKMSDDIQKKVDKIAEMEAGIKRAENGYNQIKTHRNKTEPQIDAEIEAKKKELKNAIRDNATDEQQQAKKLAAEKENTIRKIKEFQQKLADGEFEEPTPVKLRKQDAELIRLKKQQSIIEEAYRKEQKKYQEKNKSKLERLADFARSVYVAVLIGSPKTLLKVMSMSALRPLSEASSKLTLGKVFDTFFPNISKAALRGGESSSIRSIQKGFEAYFRQMGDKKLESMYDNASKQFDDARTAYNDYKNSANPDAAKLDALKSNMNDKLIKAQSSFIYKFIGGSSLKDALKALVNRSNEIEKQFGKVESESIKDGNWLDKTNYVLGFIGRSHSAAKTFSGRFSFAAGFMARLEGAVQNGEDISSPDKILEIAHESYLDWERGKYQQDNAITTWWNKNIISKKADAEHPEWQKYYNALSHALKFDVAITRVPVNILHEAVMEYTLGAFRAIGMIAKNNMALRSELKGEGMIADSPEFKAALKEKISQMDEKQAATIARAFRKGGLGVGLYATALILGGIHFGIFPHLGQKKKKDEADLKPNELNPGQIMVGNNKLGETTSAIIEHIPALWPTFMGLGMAQAYQDEIDKGKSSKEAMGKAIYTHLKVIESSIPQSKVISPTGVAETMMQTVEKKATDAGVLTKDEIDIPEFKPLKDKGIKLPSTEGTTSQYKVEVDDKHPKGIMTYDEIKQFNNTRKKYIEKEIKTILNTSYPHTKEKSDGSDEVLPNVLGKDLPKKELEEKIKAAEEDINSRVKEKMFPKSTGKVKDIYKSDDEPEKEEIILEPQK